MQPGQHERAGAQFELRGQSRALTSAPHVALRPGKPCPAKRIDPVELKVTAYESKVFAMSARPLPGGDTHGSWHGDEKAR
jgi:hypothetical protein